MTGCNRTLAAFRQRKGRQRVSVPCSAIQGRASSAQENRKQLHPTRQEEYVHYALVSLGMGFILLLLYLIYFTPMNTLWISASFIFFIVAGVQYFYNRNTKKGT